MIFNLFKSKPSLKELIPKGFVDIHSHVLPGIDDGAKDIEESIKLISEMKKMGFAKVIGTPHTYPNLYNNTIETILNSYKELTKNLNNNLDITYASEYILDSSLIEKVKQKKVLCMKDNFLLVEMSYIAPPINLYEIIYEIKVNNYIPVLAHPERYTFINSNKEYFKLKKFGCLFQANLLSATDYYGRHVRKKLDNLLNLNVIDFAGSDIHNYNNIKAFNNKICIRNTNCLEKTIENNRQFL